MGKAYISRRGSGSGIDPMVVITITLQAIGGGAGDCTGCSVLVTNTDDESELYSGKYSMPITLKLLAGTRFRVHVGELAEYIAPHDEEYNAVAGTPRTITMTYRHGTRYGFARDKNNSSPSDRIQYLFDAVGKTPMHVDLSTGTPDYGDWQDFIDGMVRPVMLWTNGTVAYELDHNDQTKRLDGGPSDVANSAFDGNAMVEFGGPFKWVRRYEDDTNEYVIFANCRFDNNYHAYAHTNINGDIKDAFYWGMFKATYTNNKLRSIGAGTIMNSTTVQNEIDRAEANGIGYYTIYKSGWDFIADILTLISKSDNSQSEFGYGYCKTTNKTMLNAGTLKNKGAFWGSSNQTTDVKVLYIEGTWGNYWERIAGMISDASNEIKVKMIPPYNINGNGYDSTDVFTQKKVYECYVDTEQVSDFGFIPKIIDKSNGSATTYMCDIVIYTADSIIAYPLVGGDRVRAEQAGSRAITFLNNVNTSQINFSTRLSYIPV